MTPYDPHLSECGLFKRILVTSPQFVNFNIFGGIEIEDLRFEPGRCAGNPHKYEHTGLSCEEIDRAYLAPEELVKLTKVKSMKRLSLYLPDQTENITDIIDQIVRNTDVEELLLYALGNQPIDLCHIPASFNRLSSLGLYVSREQIPLGYVTFEYDKDGRNFRLKDHSIDGVDYSHVNRSLIRRAYIDYENPQFAKIGPPVKWSAQEMLDDMQPFLDEICNEN